jgi:hypothetical protein
MKLFSRSLFVLVVISFIAACNGKKPVNNSNEAALETPVDTSSVADTGYTGIKQYMSGTTLIKEVTFKNGVRQGLMKSFYQTGQVRQTFWYENGVRQDSSVWYYREGQKFRTTPYKNDTIDGIVKQYYRTGQLKAKIGYSKGFRTLFFEEYKIDGNLIKGYPEVNFRIDDEYKTKGTCRIAIQMSDKLPNVKFFRGGLTNGVFDTTICKPIHTANGVAYVVLKKSSKSGSSSVDIIADVITNFGNNYLIYKKIDLPYPDLK